MTCGLCTTVARWSKQLRRDGLCLEGSNGEERIAVHATDTTSEIGPVDLVLILTKSTDTRAAAEASRALIRDASVAVTFQNGLGNLETISDILGAQRVLLGMTYVGATVTGPGRARLTAAGRTFIGEPNGQLSPRVQQLAEVLSAAGMPTA